MFPGLHPTAMMSTGGVGGIMGGGAVNFHHGGNAPGHIASGGPISNQPHPLAGNRPGHVSHGAHPGGSCQTQCW